MTITHEDLPRKDGVPIGTYNLTHKLPDYSLSGYGFAFAGGKTVEPIGGKALLRLLFAGAADLTVYPATKETADAILAHVEYRRGNDDHFRDVKAFVEGLFESDTKAAALAEQARHDAEAAERARIEEDEFAAALAAEEAANAAKASTPDAAPEGAGESSPGAAATSTSKPKVKSK